jgi:hypothetical protein
MTVVLLRVVALVGSVAVAAAVVVVVVVDI